MNNIELLKRLFTESFSQKLTTFEKNTKDQFTMINTSLSLTSQTVSLCQYISDKVKEKIESRQRGLTNSYSSSTRKNLNNGFNQKYNTSKTQVKRGLPSSKSVTRFDRSTIQEKQITKSYSIGNLLNSSRIKDKNMKRSNTVKAITPSIKQPINHIILKNGKNLNPNSSKRPSVISKLSNTSLKVIKLPTKSKNFNSSRKQTPRRVCKTIDNDNSIDKIFSIENTINNDILFSNDEPLLITPITDKDFIDLTDHLENHMHTFNYVVKNFKIEEWSEDHLLTMIKYLNRSDVINCMKVNKSFAQIINQYLLSLLEEEKEHITSIITSIEKPLTSFENSPFKLKVQFTKKTFKAIALLNESVINKLFTESKVPSNEILLIYMIYFQLIDYNNLIKEAENKKIFWKKCCRYFIVESNGKTGDLLQKTLVDDIVVTSENMYKIHHLIRNNLNKITPSYFSKMCGTTGLIVFFIQDVLEHFGISHDKKIRDKGYLIYHGINDVLEKKIEKMKSYIK